MYCSDGIDCTIENNESFWNFKGSLDTIDSWPLMSSPFPMLAIIASYLLYVLKIGPQLMKNRQPFSLHNVIVLYNILQVGASAYIVYLACQLTWQHGWIAKTCLLENEDTKNKLTIVLYYYFLAKVSETLDTIFFVLRKKYNQVTFLHVYHHALMILTSWYFLKYEPTYTTLFIRNINSVVHVVMYIYYGLSSFPSLAKYLWWKKYITTFQLVQFSLIQIHLAITYAISECTPSYSLCAVTFLNTTLFMYLFAQFYFNTYKKKVTHQNERENIEFIKENGKKIECHKENNANNMKYSNNRKKMMNGN